MKNKYAPQQGRESSSCTPVSLGAGFAVTLVAAVAASQESPTGRTLEEITITGARTDAQIQDLATTVSVVSEEQLAAQFTLATDVLLAIDVTVPGLSVSHGQRTGCASHIRGRKPSYQVNGIPVNQDLRESNCNAMFQVSPFALERVEVVRGATALYGAGAPGGIVNVITRRAESSTLEVDADLNVSLNPEDASGTEQYDLYVGAGRSAGAHDWYAGLAHEDVGAGAARGV